MNNGTGSHGLRGLYRDRENGWVFGVCAGVAERFGFAVGTVRLLSIICLIMFFWTTVTVYLAASLLLKKRPLIYCGHAHEDEFWRRCAAHDRWRHS